MYAWHACSLHQWAAARQVSDTSFQQIAFVDSETGELQERGLDHPEAAEKFYRKLAPQGKKVHLGMEASGHARWFERVLAELKFELWIGDAAEIHRKRERKQKTDRQDAQHILRLLLKDDFPQNWVPSWRIAPAATVVAPAPHGAGLHPDHEPIASGSPERSVNPTNTANACVRM